MSAHYRIVEWDRYQHYKDRDPPWIKLHRDLLTSQTWVMLSDASRVLAIACMLIAAGTDNRIPTSPDYLKRRAYLNKEPDFAPLVATGFVELVNDANVVADASTMLAAASKPEQALAFDTKCSSEERRDRGEKSRGRGNVLPDDWRPTDEQLEYAKKQGCADPADTAERFKLHHRSKGTIGKDWNAGFQYWCRNESRFAPRQTQPKANGFSKPDPQALPPSDPWEQRLQGWRSRKQWLANLWGPPPGSPGCLVPPALIGGTA